MADNGEENEQKSARVTSSIGALLSGLSTKNVAPPDPTPEPEKNEKEGFDLQVIEEINDWSQLGKMDREATGGEDGDNKFEEQQEDFGYDDSRGGTSKNRNNKREAQGDREGSGKRGRQDYKADVYGPKDVTDWNDLKMYDEDHDEEYFRDEEAVLADKYGGNFIKLKYIAEGKIGYYCEICHAEMNAKKSLELHCSGMKHLKKKDIWEKNGRKIIPGSGLGINHPPAQPPEEKEWRSSRNRNNDEFSDWRSNRNSNRGGREGRGGNWNNSRAPPAPSFRNDDYNQGSYRDRDLGGRKYYSRQEHNREPFGGRDDSYDRDSFYDRPRGSDYFRDNYRDTGLRDSYLDRREDSYLDRWGDRLEEDRPDYGRFSPKRELYPGCRRPAPREEERLAGGPTGSLLQKLGDCCVKSNDDAELAMNVISNLSVSLKEFYSIRGEAKVADLLGDVELKLKTIKALKVGLKVLGEASFCLNDDGPPPAPVPAPGGAGASSMFGSSGGFSANQPVRYPVAGLYRPPVKY